MNTKTLISCGKTTYNYVAKKGKSAVRQIAYYTVPADVRAMSKHNRIINNSQELLKRADQYEGYLLRNGKIVKAVNNVKKLTTKVSESINNMPSVKKIKEVSQKTGNFLKKWFGDGN